MNINYLSRRRKDIFIVNRILFRPNKASITTCHVNSTPNIPKRLPETYKKLLKENNNEYIQNLNLSWHVLG